MADAPADRNGQEVICPHCKRAFVAEPMTGPGGRSLGCKCPHCRLFVALDRAAPAQEA